MRAKPTAALLVLLIPTLALAQSEPDAGSQSRLSVLFWSALPIVIVSVVLFLILRFAVSGKRAKAYDHYRDRHIEHMERVELALEQIRQALERKS